jgi:hypothetical protein
MSIPDEFPLYTSPYRGTAQRSMYGEKIAKKVGETTIEKQKKNNSLGNTTP